MEQKSKNKIREILVVFLFGMAFLAMGLGLITRGLNLYGIVGSMMVPAGALLLVFGIRLVKKQW